MLTKADAEADMPQMRFERFYQKLATEIQELERRVEYKMRPSSYPHAYAPPIGGPGENALSLKGWMYLINKQMDKRAALLEQLAYFEETDEMQWAKLWQRLRNELPEA